MLPIYRKDRAFFKTSDSRYPDFRYWRMIGKWGVILLLFVSAMILLTFVDIEQIGARRGAEPMPVQTPFAAGGKAATALILDSTTLPRLTAQKTNPGAK